jgi:hypothetical protein
MIENWTTTKEFTVHEFRKEAASLQLDPGMGNWRDLRQDATLCERETESESRMLRINWNPRNDVYWLIGNPEPMDQFESIAMKAAVRLGYRGSHYVACLLECLRRDTSWLKEEFEESDFPGTVLTTGSTSIRLLPKPIPTGNWVIESVFSAVKNLFMKYEGLREAAWPSAAANRSVETIQTDLKAALDRNQIKRAVAFARELREAQGEKPRDADIYEHISMDNSTFYKILREETERGSHDSFTAVRIKRAMRELFLT